MGPPGAGSLTDAPDAAAVCRFFGILTLIITIVGLLSTGIAQVIACR